MKTLQGLPLAVLILGGQSMVNLERICEDFARVTSDSVDGGVDQWSTWKGSVNFARITCDSVDLGGQSMVNFMDLFQGVCRLTPPQDQHCQVILAMSSWILSEGCVDQPPRINTVRGNPCNVFTDPFQGVCRLTLPRINTVR